MAMVVQHNITAMNASRMLGVTTGVQSKTSEKLASGYRINRAADDAAGLSISEKMRKQIRGLDQASTNAQDGVSAVQTAEGALTEVHSMLQRMNELAVQAANGTNSESDRDAIQAEIEQLTTEIDRVAETTKFNETYMLKGNTAGTSSIQKVAAHDAGLIGKLTDNGNGITMFQLNEALEDGDKVTIAGKEYTIGTSGKSGVEGSILAEEAMNASTDGYKIKSDAVFSGTINAGDSVTYNGNTYTLTDNIAIDDISWAAGDTFKVGAVTFTIASGSADADIDESANTATIGVDKVADYIKGVLADGQHMVSATQFTTTQYASATAVNSSAQVTTATNVVAELKDGEVSSAQLASKTVANLIQGGEKSGSTTALTVSAGDSVTISGVTTVATEAAPISANTLYNNIKALDEDGTDSVTIGTGVDQVVYTLVDESDVDEENFKVTKEMVLSKIYDGATVDVNSNGTTPSGTANTVIGDIAASGSGSSSTENVISAKEAYAMMAEELQKASSIGTDTDTAAEVINNGNGKFTIKQGSIEVKDSLSFNLHVGADADMTNKITVDISAMDAASLGIKGLSVAGDTGALATYAIDALTDAISKVSSQRSALGAVQNRLEHTIANLDNVVENTTSAESRIRDTDMAEEMVEYSKNNILAQAGQSMLAQANQSTQGVLSLLQ